MDWAQVWRPWGWVSLAFLIAGALCWAWHHRLFPAPLDQPSDRSLHVSPIPRVGGLAMWLGCLGGILASNMPASYLLALAVIVGISLWDDIRSLPVSARLAAQACAAVFFVANVQHADSAIAQVAAIVMVLWFANLFNFMDGSDGLVGSLSLIGFSAMAFVALQSAAGASMSGVLLCLIAALAGFLIWNWPQARVFMGDAGSVGLGFTAASLSLLGAEQSLWPRWFPALVFFPLIADASLTLVKRALSGASIFKPHREHIYQKLVLLGFSKLQVLLIYCGLSLLSASVALLALKGQLSVLAAALVAAIPIMLLYLTTERRWTTERDRVFRLNAQMLTAYAFDIAAATFSWVLAYAIRANFEPGNWAQGSIWATLPLVAVLHAAVFFLFGLYRGLWRFASLADLQRISFAAVVATALLPLSFFLLGVNVPIPRSLLFVHPVLLVILMGGGRLLYRSWKEHRLYGINALQGEPVIVMGAAEQAAQLVRELSRGTRWQVVALLDDDATKHGAVLHDIPIVGGLDRVSEVAKQFSTQHAVIAMPWATHQERKRAAMLAGAAGLKTLTMPSYNDLMAGGMAPSALREIELDDLLGRDPVRLDEAGIGHWISDQTIMVSGAGGSIGSELCHQIGRYGPRQLVVLDSSEHALYTLTELLRRWFPALAVVAYVGDVKDEARLDEIFKVHACSVVFHAAAYKHVPLMEGENAWAALQNNALGTARLAQAAIRHNVAKFVMVSTDKAVKPASIMGASKRLAELICQALGGRGTAFVAVRFGNVLGSAGSVIPKFQEQIARGGPITVTDPEMTRYFMSIPEATQLLLQAGYMGKGGEIFVMDMGEPVKIVDLARELIRLSGRAADSVKIEFTGLRPGEKLAEIWMADYEQLEPTAHEKLRLLRTDAPLNGRLNTLLTWLSEPKAPEGFRGELRHFIPDFVPSSTSPQS